MKMKVTCFGMLVEALESSTVELDMKNDLILVAEFKIQLLNEFPKLKNMSFKVAVNQSLVDDDWEIKQNDEIALLPPFAGG